MRGFTLLEILITMAIFTGIAAAIIMVALVGDRVYQQDMGLVNLQQQARFAMDRMSRELRGAALVTITAAGTDMTFSTATTNNIRYFYNANANQLIRDFPAGTQQVAANFITAANFCCWHDDTGTCTTNCVNSNLIETNLTASRNVRGRNLTFFLRGQVRPRNE